MQFKPTPRLALFSLAVLLLLALPLLLAAAALLRAVFTPPVRGTRLAGYDGAHLEAGCTDNDGGHGRRVWLCSANFHMDSRFEIVNHDPAAVAWCVQRVNEWYFNARPAKTYGPLLVGSYPPVPRDWGGCTRLIVMKVGMYARLTIDH